jgi:AbiV family abortive infection protein
MGYHPQMVDEHKSEKHDPEIPKQYVGGLTPVDAANAIRAARINAIELYDTAEVLFHLKRFCHSVVFATLAIEEAAKISLLIMIFLGRGGDHSKLWKAYRNHRAKTTWLNPIIESRVRATFPEIPLDAAKKIGELGPTPDELESSKQRALYSDTLDVSGKFVPHLPGLIDWRKQAWDRLCEAQAITLAARDYPPKELEIWFKHLGEGKASGKESLSALPALHKDLVDKGFVRDGWWDTLLQDADEMALKP